MNSAERKHTPTLTTPILVKKKKTARSVQNKDAERKCLKRVVCFKSAFYFAREVANEKKVED